MTPMHTHNVQQFDTLDDRREIWVLLSKLRPVDRLGFLKVAAAWSVGPDGRTPPELEPLRRDAEMVRAANGGDREADRQLTQTCWGWLMMLGNGWNLDMAKVTITLESLGRGRVTLRELR